MGISRRKIIIGKKKISTMYTFSYFRKMASISPFFLCSSKRLSKWSSLTFGFAWLNFQGPNKPFKHKLKFPLEPWGQTLNYVAIDFHFYIFTSYIMKNRTLSNFFCRFLNPNYCFQFEIKGLRN